MFRGQVLGTLAKRSLPFSAGDVELMCGLAGHGTDPEAFQFCGFDCATPLLCPPERPDRAGRGRGPARPREWDQREAVTVVLGVAGRRCRARTSGARR